MVLSVRTAKEKLTWCLAAFLISYEAHTSSNGGLILEGFERLAFTVSVNQFKINAYGFYENKWW